jgi:hypothetical protein
MGQQATMHLPSYGYGYPNPTYAYHQKTRHEQSGKQSIGEMNSTAKNTHELMGRRSTNDLFSFG